MKNPNSSLIKLTVICCLIFIFSLFAPAQEVRGVKVKVQSSTGDFRDLQLYNASYALVIGAINYQKPGWGKLSSVGSDVKDVGKILRRHGFEVEELLDPTSENLKPTLEQFVKSHALQPGNRILIYFSGHGYTETEEDGRKFGYIVPVDAPDPQKDMIGFQQKALTMDEIETLAKQIRSKHALFVFDSCFSGTLINKSKTEVPKVIDYLAAQPVRQFITAGAENQEVPAESVFRKMFVRGLEGEADSNGDGYITGTELAVYLQDRVISYQGTSQTPQYGKIREPLLDRGDFIFVKPKMGDKNLAQSLARQALDKLAYGDFEEAQKLAQASIEVRDDIALALFVNTIANVFYGKISLPSEKEFFGRLSEMEPTNGCYLLLTTQPNKKDDENTIKKAFALMENSKSYEEIFIRGLLKIDISQNIKLSDEDRVKKAQEARNDMETAIRMNPNCVGCRILYVLQDSSNNPVFFISQLTEAIKTNPQFPLSYMYRGLFYEKKSQFKEAIADFTKIIELDSKIKGCGRIDGYRMRANAYSSMGRIDLAKADNEMAVRISSSK